MDIATIVEWVEASRLATTIRDSLFLFPMIESIHVIGLAMVFGTITIIDLRLLGVASVERPFKRMASEILKWTWGAFAITTLTGVLMFVTNAGVYYHNFYFRSKMLLLVLAGLNMTVFEATLGRSAQSWDRSPSTPRAGRVVGALSLTIWICVIVAGRMIGFTTSRAAEASPASDINFEDLLK